MAFGSKVHIVSLATLMLQAAVISFGQECVPLSETLSALEQLTQRNWLSLTLNDARLFWPVDPETSPCTGTPCSGWTDEWRAGEAQCKACGSWSFLGFAEGIGASRTLSEIDVLACTHTFKSIEETWKRVVDAVGPPEGSERTDARSWNVEAKDETRFRAYRWHSSAGPVSLDVRVAPVEGAWQTSIRLYACPSPAVESTLILGDVQLAFVRLEDGEDDNELLIMEYVSQCHTQDWFCVVDEVQRLWPSLRQVAENRNKPHVWLSPTGCGASWTFFLRREADGWSGAPFPLPPEN